MEQENSLGAKARIVLATYPDRDVIYMTSNGKAFFEKHDADSHSQTLLDKEVKVFSRKLIETFDELQAKIAEEKAKGGEAGGEGAEETQEGKENDDLSTHGKNLDPATEEVAEESAEKAEEGSEETQEEVAKEPVVAKKGKTKSK